MARAVARASRLIWKQQPLERIREPDEPQPRYGGLRPVRQRPAAVVEHAEVADHRRESGRVPGRGDHRVGDEPRAVGQHGLVALEPGQRGDRGDPPGAQLRDQPDVDGRGDARGPHLADHAAARGREAVARQVADEAPLQEPVDRVGQPGGGEVHRDGQQRRRDRAELRGTTFGGVRTASHTVRGPALGEVGGDLGAGVPGADDEDVPAAVLLGARVGRRVQHLAAEGVLSRPGRCHRRAVVPGGDDDLPRRQCRPVRCAPSSRRRPARGGAPRCRTAGLIPECSAYCAR